MEYNQSIIKNIKWSKSIKQEIKGYDMLALTEISQKLTERLHKTHMLIGLRKLKDIKTPNKIRKCIAFIHTIINHKVIKNV